MQSHLDYLSRRKDWHKLLVYVLGLLCAATWPCYSTVYGNLVSVTVKYVYGVSERCILSNIFQSLGMSLI